MKMKKCTKCGKEYPATKEYFRTNKSTKDGLSYWCKECRKPRDRIYSRKYRREHPEWKKMDNKRNAPAMGRAVAEWNRTHPEAIKCWAIYNKALKNGKLKRKPCEICGNPRSHGHHERYDRPLKVRWLCAEHHKAVHFGLIDLPAKKPKSRQIKK